MAANGGIESSNSNWPLVVPVPPSAPPHPPPPSYASTAPLPPPSYAPSAPFYPPPSQPEPAAHPLPPSRPPSVPSAPPSYAPASPIHQKIHMIKRRPLSTTMANGASRSPSQEQPPAPAQGMSTSGGRQIPIRKSSFEIGDDEYLRKPGSTHGKRYLQKELPREPPRSVSAETPRIVSSEAPRQISAELPRNVSSEAPRSVSAEPPRFANSGPPWNISAELPRNVTSEPLQNTYSEPTQNARSEPPRKTNRPTSIITQSIPYRQRQTMEAPELLQQPQAGIISSANGSAPSSRHTSGGSWMMGPLLEEPSSQPLQYHHQAFDEGGNRKTSGESSVSGRGARRVSGEDSQVRRVSGEAPPTPSSRRISFAPNQLLGASLPRPQSAYSSGSEAPGRTRSPGQFSNARTPSPNRHSPDNRPVSYIDLLNVPYPQPPPAPSTLDNAHLRSSVGGNAHLLSQRKTLDMYRANIKKTNDPTISYEFAVFMISAAQEQAAASGIDIYSKAPASPKNHDGSEATPAELLREARNILQKLSDRSYPFAQYYLADGYASGLFAKGNPDNDRAFPLFIAASKHGHAEAGYRAALCYEFGWGCRKDFARAVQFYRQSASKNHPGAMSRLGRACLVGDLGLANRHKEGLKWLKRAAESADFQYNSAPYELGLLHETGYGDDIFRDESYAAQLFTQSADLGHVEANYRLGDSYEHGKLSCPKDPALSVHFYTGAASRGHDLAMMALCAWYMIGAEPVLEKDEGEAYQWARQAAECGLPKAEYAVGYFTEMGIGCRRDPLEANVWYVKAADQGDERAKHRIAAIRAAASGAGSLPPQSLRGVGKEKEGRKKWGIF